MNQQVENTDWTPDQLASSMRNELDENYCYSIHTLALRWGFSRETVRRIVKREFGVLRYRNEPLPGKRAYVRYSIPGAVAKRMEARLKNDPKAAA